MPAIKRDEARSADIYLSITNGSTLEPLSNKYNISRERVRQIYIKEAKKHHEGDYCLKFKAFTHLVLRKYGIKSDEELHNLLDGKKVAGIGKSMINEFNSKLSSPIIPAPVKSVIREPKKDYSDLIGKRFGRLVIIEDPKKVSRNSGRILICKCDCGNTKEFLASNVIRGKSSSCGCWRKEYYNSLRRTGTERVGKWIKDTNTDGVKCDCCGYTQEAKTKHCPNCGRLMKNHSISGGKS